MEIFVKKTAKLFCCIENYFLSLSQIFNILIINPFSIMKRVLLAFVCVFFSLNLIPTLHSQTLFNPSLWVKPKQVQGDSLSLTITPTGLTTDSTSRKAGYINYNVGINSIDSIPITLTLPKRVFSFKRATIMTAYLTESPNKIGLWEVIKDTLRPIWLNSQELSYKNISLNYRDTTETGPIVNISHFNYPVDTSSNTTIDSLHLMKEGTNLFEGIFGEFIYFDTTLSSLHEGRWETYLALKYGATLKRNYINSTCDTIWNVTQDSLYSKGIAGIGKDSTTTLQQLKSNIYNDIVTIESQEPINTQGTYLLWGHNNMDVLPSLPITIDTIEYYQILRQWKIKPTYGATNHTTLQTTLSYTYPTYAYPHGIALFIDRSNTTGLDPYTSDIHYPDSVDTERVYFHNLQWDTDQSGSDYFSIAIHSDSLSRYLITKTTTSEEGETNSTTAETLILTLHPNPSTGLFTLIVKQSNPESLTIRISDNMGKEIRRYTKPEAGNYTKIEDTIDTMGVYFIQVESPSSRKTIKLVIVK